MSIAVEQFKLTMQNLHFFIINVRMIIICFLIQQLKEIQISMSQQQNTPQYIKQVPWYARNTQGQGQSIHTPQFQPKSQIQDWYNRGKKGQRATTFRKGSCQNCGAMGHNKKQCTERPRKIGAKFTNTNIAADDIVQNLKFNWQSKRDRWNGFQPEMYKQVIEQHEQYEQIRKKAKLNEGEQEDAQFRQVSNPVDLANLPTKHAKNQKFQGLGNVRNRQDTAKYLYDLNLNGPQYDPKSRTMKGQDVLNLNNLEVLGQKSQLQNQIDFAARQVEKYHAELSSTALPTLTQKIYKNMKMKNKTLTSGKLGQISKKYDIDANTLQKPDTLVYEQDQYAEYNPNGQIKKPIIIKSKYQEDIMVNDHTSVWGSWYNKILGWGYSCCHATQKMSYCLGPKGIQKALAKQLRVKAQKLRQLQQLEQIEQKQEDNQKQQEKIKITE